MDMNSIIRLNQLWGIRDERTKPLHEDEWI